MISSRAGGWGLDRRKVLEDLQEEDDDDYDGMQSDVDLDENNCGKIVQEVKYCSKVQFRAPDIIELWWINDRERNGRYVLLRRKDSGDEMLAEATRNLENFPVLTRTLAARVGFARWKETKGNG